MRVNLVNKSKHPLPSYSTILSAGVDLRANIDKEIVLEPLKRVLVPTGLFIQLPEGYEAQIRPRSGLAIKHGVTVLNTPGTIDADYRGEICVILVNISDETFTVKDGERICQMVIAKHETVDWAVVDSLQETERGAGGFFIPEKCDRKLSIGYEDKVLLLYGILLVLGFSSCTKALLPPCYQIRKVNLMRLLLIISILRR